ncbi:hypothetical protein EJ05DRAFT_536527 [Pseudovirgaria hyperparasitica]|uniref:Uncharacterized protein n=1 Tax=Pseudovirgaria hyperparasitica TaxID=470096 RepID=A0A6A6WCW6_9PEZI|nr:uncharacterized protein EJ05DRAFT_536527 [Pseudovirgaria hyperparasitica]KAF2760415.1 hypothetical protein EJ05DRAFT_536527 [Pseudovirgaria hyperparasitica]
MVSLTLFAVLFSIFFLSCITQAYYTSHISHTPNPDSYYIHPSCHDESVVMVAISEAIYMARRSVDRLDSILTPEDQSMASEEAVVMREILDYTFGINDDNWYLTRQVHEAMRSIASMERTWDLDASKVRFYCDNDKRFVSPPEEVVHRADSLGNILPWRSWLNRSNASRYSYYFDAEQNRDGTQPWRWRRGTPLCRSRVDEHVRYIWQLQSYPFAEIVLCPVWPTRSRVSSIYNLLKEVDGKLSMGLSLSERQTSNPSPTYLTNGGEVYYLSSMRSLSLLKDWVQVREPRASDGDDHKWEEVVVEPPERKLSSVANYAFFGLLTFLLDYNIKLSPFKSQAMVGDLVHFVDSDESDEEE